MKNPVVMAASILIASLASTFPCAAQESNTMILVGEHFVEQLNPPTQFNRVPVAGLYVHAPQSGALPVLRALLPDEMSQREFCVRAISADGFYEAVNTYQLPEGVTGGIGIFPFGTNHPDKLTSLGARDLGLAVLEGACREGGGASPAIFPAFWNADPDVTDATVSLAVNSMRAERVFLYIGPDNSNVVLCTAIDGPVRHNFDTLCTFGLEKLPVGRTVLRIVAVADQRPRPEEEVVVIRGGGTAGE